MALTCFGVRHRRLPQSPLTVRMRMAPPSHPREANRRRPQVRRWSTIRWSCPGVICTDLPQQKSWTSWRRQKACFTAVCSKCRWGSLSLSCPRDDMQTAGSCFTHSPHMSVMCLRQQMEELLKEVTLSERRKQQIDSFIKTLTKLLQKVPATPEVEVCGSLTGRNAPHGCHLGSFTLNTSTMSFLLSGEWSVVAVRLGQGPLPPGAQNNKGQVPHGASSISRCDRQLPTWHLH